MFIRSQSGTRYRSGVVEFAEKAVGGEDRPAAGKKFTVLECGEGNDLLIPYPFKPGIGGGKGTASFYLSNLPSLEVEDTHGAAPEGAAHSRHG